MNCKECIYNEVCYWYKVTYTDNNPICCYFKDKSRFVELPCKVGDAAKTMKILVACEESQVVTVAFRAKGYEAFSCDIQECSGGHPEWHIKGDVLPLLNGRIVFKTCDGHWHFVEKWDMIIAFPPCTHLADSGAAWFEKKRADGRQKEAIEFFAKIFNADCEKIAIENPVGIISGKYILKHFPDLANKYNMPYQYSQIIQPFQFGDPFEKKTCLWLKNLPLLQPTHIVKPPARVQYDSGRTMPKWYADAWKLPPADRARVRSKTFRGIAYAMADQWG